jgi:chromodomain-helicase-DNA-binding protein 7
LRKAKVPCKNEKKLTKQEIEILLKKGILGLVENEQQNVVKNDFFEQNIDEILERNSR